MKDINNIFKRLKKSLLIRSRISILKNKYKIHRHIVLRKYDTRRWEYAEVLTNIEPKNWSFHDENWDQIINRWQYREILLNGGNLNLIDTPQKPTAKSISYNSDNAIVVNNKAMTEDEWIYLYLNPNIYKWVNYSFRFCIKFETIFKEFQVDFRYNDLFNRYRYRFQDGYLYFDIVYKGEFIPALSKTKFILEPGVTYQIEIKVMEDLFQIWINNKLISTDTGTALLPTGPIAIILWEDNGITDMKVKMHSFKANNLLFR